MRLRPSEEVFCSLPRGLKACGNILEVQLLELLYNIVDPGKDLADLGGARGDDRILGGEIEPGRQVVLFGVPLVELDEDDARDPCGSQRRHAVFLHVFFEIDLHDHLDETVVWRHPDILYAPHVYPAVLDGGIPLEPLDRLVK